MKLALKATKYMGQMYRAKTLKHGHSTSYLLSHYHYDFCGCFEDML